MRVLKTLRPGAPGTRRFLAWYGDSLVCVRYRYDAATGTRLTSVEVRIEPPRPYTRPQPLAPAKAMRPKPVWIRVRWDETLLRQRVKAAGGKWRPDEKLWEVTPQIVKTLRLRDRVVLERERHSAEMPSTNAYPWRDTSAD